MTLVTETSSAGMTQRRSSGLLAAPLLGILLTGCQTWQKTHESALNAWAAGNAETSLNQLQDAQKTFRSEKNLLDLDLAVLELASGQPAAAEARFRKAREALKYLTQKDITEQTASILTDSRAVAYSGRDFERAMLLNMAMLSSMVSDGQDAFAYSLQFTEAAAQRRKMIADAVQKKKNDAEIAENTAKRPPGDTTGIARVSYSPENSSVAITATPVDQPLALGAWLTALVQSETPSRAVETEQALADIQFWNPSFSKNKKDSTAGEGPGVRSKKGCGTLAVIALCGHAPQWTAERAEPTSTALLIADRILSATGKHTLPPTISSVKIARPCKEYARPVTDWIRTDVKSTSATGTRRLDFHRLVDLHDVAEASYQEHKDEEIAAAIVRRITKKGVIYAVKETSNVHRNTFVDLGVNAAGVAWEALEKPDTRSWRTLPGVINVATCELPAEQHTISLSSVQFTERFPGPPISLDVHIEDGRNTWIVVMVPDKNITGNILVGGTERRIIPVSTQPPAPKP